MDKAECWQLCLQIWGIVLVPYIHFQNKFTCVILFNPLTPGEIDKLGTFISPI